MSFVIEKQSEGSIAYFHPEALRRRKLGRRPSKSMIGMLTFAILLLGFSLLGIFGDIAP